MALTSGTKGFYFRKNMEGGNAHPPLAEFVIDDSKTITLGDAITLASGLADVCTAAERPVGIAVGFVDKNGLPLIGYNSHADYDGTVTGDDTYTSAADNSTDHKVKVQVMLIRPNDLYYNDCDSTLTIANVGSFYDMESTGDQVDVGGGGGTPAVWQLVEIDPDGDADASKGLWRCAEPFFRYV